MHGAFVILHVLEVEHAQIEVRLKVFWVDHDSPLVEVQNFVYETRSVLAILSQRFQALCLAIDRINVLRISLQDLLVQFHLCTDKKSN